MVLWLGKGVKRDSLCLSIRPLLLALCPEARAGLVLRCVVRIACPTVLRGRGREVTFMGKETDRWDLCWLGQEGQLLLSPHTLRPSGPWDLGTQMDGGRAETCPPRMEPAP